MNNTAKWWHSTGCSSLNKLLNQLKGKQIGSVPLSNLIEIPNQVDDYQLRDLIKNDGVKAIVFNFGTKENPDEEVCIWIS